MVTIQVYKSGDELRRRSVCPVSPSTQTVPD